MYGAIHWVVWEGTQMRTQDYALVTVTALVLALAVVYATGLEGLLSRVAETFTSLHGR